MPPASNVIVKKIPMDKTEIPILVSRTLEIMEELATVLALENELVPARKIAEHGQLLARKQRLTMDYRSNMKAFAAQPDILKPLPESLRAKIKDTAQKLAEATDRNAKMLRMAVVATQRLIQDIISMIKSEVLPAKTYRNPKTAYMELGTYSPTCKPVAGSRTV